MPKYDFATSKSREREKNMKCFSVHMIIGVIEGIRLDGPKRDLIRIGSLQSEYVATAFVEWTKSQTRTEVIETAEIIFQHRYNAPTFREIEGFNDPVATRHIVHPNQDCAKNRALIKIGFFVESYTAIPIAVTDEGVLMAIEPYLIRRGLVNRVAYGWAFNKKYQKPVGQALLVIKKRSGILLLANTPTVDSVLILWDGSELKMICKPDLSQIVA
jgi:hypothetical protein